MLVMENASVDEILLQLPHLQLICLEHQHQWYFHHALDPSEDDAIIINLQLALSKLVGFLFHHDIHLSYAAHSVLLTLLLNMVIKNHSSSITAHTTDYESQHQLKCMQYQRLIYNIIISEF